MAPTPRQVADAARIYEPCLRYLAWMKQAPAASYQVNFNGKPVVSGATGLADIAQNREATTHTAYRCASITKTFTATLIMQLFEAHKLSLDDEVSKYLPWARPALAGSGVTIRHLLLHAGGVIRDGSKGWSDTGLPTREEVRADVLRGATFGGASGGFRYSNVGYALLGDIIEVVTGKSFADVIDKRIVRPAGMTASGTRMTAALKKTLATGYFFRRPGEEWRAAAITESGGFEPAGGMISNVIDLCAYQDAHMPGDTRLLSDLSKRDMQRTQWQRSEPPNHGLGWMGWTVDGIGVWGHSGGYPGFVTKIGFAPDLRMSAAVLTNTIGPTAGLGVDLWYHTVAFVERRWAACGEGSAGRPALDRLAGLYKGDWGDVLVAVVNKSLILAWVDEDRPMQTASRLRAGDNGGFIIADESDYGYRGEGVSFEVDARGRGTALRYGPYLLEKMA